jgi:hypothetical protein
MRDPAASLAKAVAAYEKHKAEIDASPFTDSELREMAQKMRSPLRPLPGWHDDDKMRVWVDAMLNRVVMAEALEAQYGAAHLSERERKAAVDAAWRRGFPQEPDDDDPVGAAKQGDIEPLRDAHPDLADYLHLPKRKPNPPPIAGKTSASVQRLPRTGFETPWKLARVAVMTAEARCGLFGNQKF